MHMEKVDYFKSFPFIPDDYRFKDWKETTINYLSYIFNPENKYIGKDAKGNDVTIETSYLAKSENYEEYFHEDNLCFGLTSYFGSERKAGYGEAINVIAAILSGSLVGLDMTKYKYNDKAIPKNYVKDCVNFFSCKDKEYVIENSAGRLTGSTFWYELLPGCLFNALYDFYKEESYLKDIILKSAKVWLDAIDDMGGENISFDGIVSFNLKTREKVVGKWSEPDASAALAYIMYNAYSILKDDDIIEANEYLKRSIWCMNYMQSLNESPFYEECAMFAVSVGAKLNTLHNMNYDIDKFIRFICDGASTVRNGWGMINEKWGNACCYGLVGSRVDGGGYAFTMNSFQFAWALLPLVKYDYSYADSIGKWFLNATNSARYFYGDSLPTDGDYIFQEYGDDIYQHFNVHTWTHYDGLYQSCDYFSNKKESSFIAYEGLRKYKKGFAWTENSDRVYFYKPYSPYASGDCYTYNWKGSTDLGLYGSSNVGFFGGVVEKTSELGIIIADIGKLDFLENNKFKTVMIYNPYDSNKTINYQKENETYRLFDVINKKLIQGNEINLNPKTSLVLVELPNNGNIEEYNNALYLNDTFICKK